MMWRKTKGTGAQLGKSKGDSPSMERVRGEQREVDSNTSHLPRPNPNHLYVQNGEPIPLFYLQSSGMVKR